MGSKKNKTNPLPPSISLLLRSVEIPATVIDMQDELAKPVREVMPRLVSNEGDWCKIEIVSYGCRHRQLETDILTAHFAH